MNISHTPVIVLLLFVIASLIYVYYHFMELYKETKVYVMYNTAAAKRRLRVNRQTRPDGGPYKHLGNLIEISPKRQTRPLILPLWGKPRYRGSRMWNYHTFTDQHNPIKLPVHRENEDCDAERGCEELYANDTLHVAGFPPTVLFRYQKYALQAPRYIPY